MALRSETSFRKCLNGGTKMAIRVVMPYGNSVMEAEMDWGQSLGTLDIADVPGLNDLQTAYRRAVDQPIGLSSGIWKSFRPGETVAIVLSDAFRHTGMDQLLPFVLDDLSQAGIAEEDILFAFATGTHRPPTQGEQARIAGADLFARFQSQCLVHDPQDEAGLIYVGETRRGTPVWINQRVYDCDRVILTGSVVLHYFAGFGGGRKALLPGLAGAATIAHNHALNLDSAENRLNPAVRIGVLDGNPVAEDMLEAAQLCKADGIINTVLNRRGEIAGIFAGEMDAAHRAAARFAWECYAAPIRRRADLVIASAGDAANFLQSHKALFNASLAATPQGRIVLLAPAPEGLGADRFGQWLALKTRDAIFAELRKHAEINGQTALSTIEKAPKTILVTDLSDKDVALIGARKAASLDAALALARAELRETGVADPTCYCMPSASYTVPWFGDGEKNVKVLP